MTAQDSMPPVTTDEAQERVSVRSGDLLCHGLIDHLLKCNREQILARSLLHCHAENVHSIMLLECPGKTIRLFVAEPGHKLWDNSPERFSLHQSVSFHAHHCELTLVPTRGNVWNWIVAPNQTDGFTADEYQYQSAITHGKIGFARVGEKRLNTVEYAPLPVGTPKYMEASTIHTVVVPEGEWAAWFALEGRENPANDNHCWSMTPVDKQDFGGFYKPMTEENLNRLLREAPEWHNESSSPTP